MKEIGSEFWKLKRDNVVRKDNMKFFSNLGMDIKFLMSGRTAIDYVLNNIKDTKKKVYMPDYCCASMVQPFIDHQYSIEYYKADLINKQYDIDDKMDCSVFFSMSYFGYSESNMDIHIKKIKKKNVIVIEDITHRLFCQKNYCEDADYLIASLRKWLPIYTGGIAVSTRCYFDKTIDHYTVNEELIKYKKQAMQLKYEYMNDINTDCKEMFLEIFKMSNKLFLNYQNRKIDTESLEILKTIDLDDVRRKRISNTKIIEKNFHNTDNIKLLYKYKSGDCPLFVPIISKNRDNIRGKLNKNNIYCPIHWPKPNTSNNELYDSELSLICDQRYSPREMEEEIKIILENQ